MTRKRISWLLACLFAAPLFGAAPADSAPQAAPAAAAADAAPAADTAAPSTQPTTQPDYNDVLGPAFSSPMAGIELRPPLHMNEVHRQVPDEIVEFVDEKRGWLLKVSRATFERAMPLLKHADQFGQNPQPGLLEMTAQKMVASTPGADMLRQDKITVGKTQIGMIAMRSALGDHPRLTQEALVEADPQFYYILEFVTPGRAATAPQDQDDPGERAAVDAFNDVVETIKLLDRRAIKDDQDQRLFHSLSLITNWTNDRVTQAIIPEQWFRLVRDGKDIGYTYTVEEVEKGKVPGKDSIKIGTHSRTYPDASMQVDAETWMSCTTDRDHESWSSVARVEDKTKKGPPTTITEIGTCEKETKTIPVKRRPRTGEDGAGLDGMIHEIKVVDRYVMNVQRFNRQVKLAPIDREPPDFYIPQAISQLLPRLMDLKAALDKPRKYMFATYVSDQGEIMARYLDVLPDQEVEFDGQKIHAMQIKDRIGLQGPVTTHYMTTDGKYLGSESKYVDETNKEISLLVLPSSAAELQRIWPNPELAKPKPAEAPQGQPVVGGTGNEAR